MDTAKQLEKQQEYQAAADQYAAAIALEPLALPSQDSSIRRGRCLEKVNKLSEAVAAYDTAISIAAARADEEGAKGVLLQSQKRYALFARADVLKKSENLEAAAQAYQTAADTVIADLSAQPISATMRQDAAVNLQNSGLQAASFLESHGQPDRALTIYEQIIAIGDARAFTADGENIRLILDAQCEGLFRKALLCKKQDSKDKARECINRLRAEFPVWRRLAECSVLEAQLNDQPIDQAESQVQREREAYAALDQALQSATVEQGLIAADDLLARYWNTTAAIATLRKKAGVLGGLKRFAEAEAALSQVLTRLRQTAPKSEFFLSARVQLKHLIGDSISDKLITGRMPNDERFDQFRDVCNDVIANDIRPEEAAQTVITLAESYAWQKRYAESAAIAERFLTHYDPEHFHIQTMWAHYFAGIAALELGQHELSLNHLNWIKSRPDLDPESGIGKKVLPMTYHQIWVGLKRNGASPEVVSQAEQEWKAIQPTK